MKPLFVVIQVEINDRQIVLITSSYKKAQKVADKLQEQNNPDLNNDNSNGIVYEVISYRGFRKIEDYYFN